MADEDPVPRMAAVMSAICSHSTLTCCGGAAPTFPAAVHRPCLQDGVSEVKEIIAGFGLDFQNAALAARFRKVSPYQVGRESFREAVREHFPIFKNKQIGQRGVAAHVMVDQLLERHQIVGQDFVGRLQNDLM